jgi:hypothetical protein
MKEKDTMEVIDYIPKNGNGGEEGFKTRPNMFFSTA